MKSVVFVALWLKDHRQKPLAKGEFLYVKFDNFTTFTTGPFSGVGTGNVAPREVKLEDFIWRAGMNYKFY